MFNIVPVLGDFYFSVYSACGVKGKLQAVITLHRYPRPELSLWPAQFSTSSSTPYSIYVMILLT